LQLKIFTMKNKILLAVLLLFISAAIYKACKDAKPEDAEPDDTVAPAVNTKIISYSTIGQYPHDTATFTQGLEFYKGKLFESGGDLKNSVLRFGDAKTGVAEKKNMMGTDKIFAEGITILNEKIYQLTWQTHEVFVYDVNDITKPIQQLTWALEGWGITNNGTDLLITTGDTKLHTVDPLTFKIKNTVEIHDATGPIKEVNELEYVDGFVWGNRWHTNDIVKINPATGEIVGKMNFDNLLDPKDEVGRGEERTLNGIAYNKETKTFFITGKRWPKMFEVRVN
jgi:glutaminyl-peptide cyclotransferase